MIINNIKNNKMNKETRSFIWGLILVLICGSGFAIHIIEIKIGKPRDWYDWTLMILTLYGLISGGWRVFRAVD
jgi:hypothetical protein